MFISQLPRGSSSATLSENRWAEYTNLFGTPSPNLLEVNIFEEAFDSLQGEVIPNESLQGSEKREVEFLHMQLQILEMAFGWTVLINKD